ncbi:MAG: MCE family protein [Planctomycetes bacterium]|nr:MCE family protein [Planctomycetota bacterium]
MRETRRNLLVGLFVLFGLTALGTLVVLFGQGPTWFIRGNTYDLDIHFDTVSGIRPGTLVTLFGKTIGRVQEVEFRDPENFIRGVKVTVAIDTEYRLPKGSRAETVEAGLGMGRPPIQIFPGPADEQVLPPGSYIRGETRKAVETLFPGAIVSTFETTAAQIGEAAAALTPVLNDLREVMRPRTPGQVDSPTGPPGNLSSAMARFDSTLKHFNTVLGDPEVQSQLRDAVANFHRITEDGKVAVADLRATASDAREIAVDTKALVGKATDSLEQLDSHAENVSRAATDVLDQAARLLEPLHAVAGKLARGEGTIGRLFKDDRLYEAMVLTFQRLESTATEFELLVKDWQKGKVRVGF